MLIFTMKTEVRDIQLRSSLWERRFGKLMRLLLTGLMGCGLNEKMLDGIEEFGDPIKHWMIIWQRPTKVPNVGRGSTEDAKPISYNWLPKLTTECAGSKRFCFTIHGKYFKEQGTPTPTMLKCGFLALLMKYLSKATNYCDSHILDKLRTPNVVHATKLHEACHWLRHHKFIAIKTCTCVWLLQQQQSLCSSLRRTKKWNVYLCNKRAAW